MEVPNTAVRKSCSHVCNRRSWDRRAEWSGRQLVCGAAEYRILVHYRVRSALSSPRPPLDQDHDSGSQKVQRVSENNLYFRTSLTFELILLHLKCTRHGWHKQF